MDFLKRNAFILICLVVGLGTIGIDLAACSNYASIQESLDQAARISQDLEGAGRAAGRPDPIVPEDLKGQELQKKIVEDAVQATRQKALATNKRGLDPLLAGVFPNQTERIEVKQSFIRAYREAVQHLPDILKAKGPPNQEDVNRAKAAIDAENEAMAPEGKTARTGRTERTPKAAPRRTADERGMSLKGLAIGGKGRAPLGVRSPTPTKAGADGKEPMSEEERIRTDPNRRAELARAMEIQCYVAADPAQTFTVVQRAIDPTAPPNASEMWVAQMTLWVQQEICQALAQVNGEAAKQIAVANKNAPIDVTTLPVKHLKQLLVRSYRTSVRFGEEEPSAKGSKKRGGSKKPPKGRSPSDRPGAPVQGLRGLAAGPGMKGLPIGPGVLANQPADATGTRTTDLGVVLAGSTWTGREGDPDLDIVPVGMRLVMDIRHLPRVIDRICRSNFYVPTHVSYRALRPEELAGPFIYGADPVAEVTLSFERYFFPEVYADKMPQVVHEQLGRRPGGEDDRGGRRSRSGGTRRRSR